MSIEKGPRPGTGAAGPPTGEASRSVEGSRLDRPALRLRVDGLLGPWRRTRRQGPLTGTARIRGRGRGHDGVRRRARAGVRGERVAQERLGPDQGAADRDRHEHEAHDRGERIRTSSLEDGSGTVPRVVQTGGSGGERVGRCATALAPPRHATTLAAAPPAVVKGTSPRRGSLRHPERVDRASRLRYQGRSAQSMTSVPESPMSSAPR